MGDPANIGVIAAVVGAGMTIGSVFAFSTFVMPALRSLDEDAGIRAMQRINETVYTAWFMGAFLGTTVLSAGAVVFGLMNLTQAWGPSLLLAGSTFVGGVFGVTAFGNVPLNEKLARMTPDEAATNGFWRRYLIVWTRWNHARVVSGALSIALYSWALSSA